MDFAKTLREIEDRLAAREIDWAVVGGVLERYDASDLLQELES